MADHITNFHRIRLTGTHPLLSFTHFTRRYHLHGFSDFLRAFNARYFRAYLFSDGHSLSAFSSYIPVTKKGV
jgi:hypothetical protein